MVAASSFAMQGSSFGGALGPAVLLIRSTFGPAALLIRAVLGPAVLLIRAALGPAVLLIRSTFEAGGGHMRIASLFYAQILRNGLVLCKPFGHIELLIFPMPNISKKIGHRRKSFLYRPFRFT